MSGRPPAEATPRSGIRARQAEATRHAVLAAASQLFASRGYTGTSIDAIAETAGVSRSTVFTAAGGKPYLLKTVYDQAVVGDERPVPLAGRPESQKLRALGSGAEIVAAYADILAPAVARVSALYDVVRTAADTDEDVAALWADIGRQRLEGARQIVALLTAAEALSPRLTPDRAADVITVYNDPGLHRHLVGDRDWTYEAFRDWLARALHHELLT
ncbi:transcriptional regulator, TetR family [Streptomyces sp. DvalAA-14]|uniref:TetR/AcrR family transcriptional regulator n=1 Tax=unclassified Streptomyces TaxID=2593676 RepID=UPI00081B2A26|nr:MULTISPECIES: TetR/AcrR family transcriptional regulator [unclassified Streptomyces]MYS22178.1 TetR family transcriptional regulator [Streptomyces sp. SID4948]SCE10257.1 transcriptional regulator, TetR family [Streptomyces sp. DvalAA-14]